MNRRARSVRLFVACGALLAAWGSLVVEGCGGSSRGGPPTPTGGATLTGTTATGRAIANATITIKDRNGFSRSGQSNANGSYTIDVTGLTQPLLVKVDLPAGTSLFSVAALGSGVCNVTPLTDLIVQTYFQVQGTTAANAFSTLASTTKVPSPIEVTTLTKIVVTVVARALQGAGLDPLKTDLITTPFTPTGTGLDAVLAQTVVAGTTVTITNGTTTQTSTVTSAPTTGAVTITTTTTSPAGTSTSTDTTTLPGTSNFQAAVNGVNATFAQLQTTVNAKGSALAASDLTPFVATNFLDNSENAANFTAEAATGLRGSTINSFTIDRVNSYDDTNKILDASATLLATPAGTTVAIPNKFRMTFQLVGSTWVMRGNQQIARAEAQVEVRTFSSSTGVTSTNGVNIDVGAIQSTITGGTVTGGGIFTNTALTKGQTRSKALIPTPGGPTSFLVFDDFFAIVTPSTQPAAGTVFTINLTPATGSPVTYTPVSNGITTEVASVTAPTTHALASVVSQTITVSWTLPKTFAVSEIRLHGDVKDASNAQFQINPNGGSFGNLATTATTATITYPATMPGSGNAITGADFGLLFLGPNGERTNFQYTFP